MSEPGDGRFEAMVEQSQRAIVPHRLMLDGQNVTDVVDVDLTPRQQALSFDARKPPKTIAQWRRVSVRGAEFLASLGVDIEGEPPNAILKWVAVIYPDADSGALYYRGESLSTMDAAIEAAGSLIPDDALPAPHVHEFTKFAAKLDGLVPACACGALAEGS